VDAEVIDGGDWDASQEFLCWSAVDIEHLALDSTEHENIPFLVDAEITGNGHALDPDRIWIEYRLTRPGYWIQVDMQYEGEGHWQATIPGQEQPTELSYFIHAENVMGDIVTAPSDGSNDPYVFDVAWIAQSFEMSDGGFLVDFDGDDDAITGLWEHADLDAGSSWVYEPERDHTSLGSKCWITERGDVGVSPGETTLQSPVYDLTGATIAKVKYWRWYFDDPHEQSDSLLVQVRNDRGPWTEIAGTPDRAWQWVQAEHDLYAIYGDDLGAVELRFTVSQQGDIEIVEAGIDDLVILTDLESISSAETGCAVAPSISCKVTPNPFCSMATVHFTMPMSGPVHLTVHDVAGRLVATLIARTEVDAGEHHIPWNGMSNQGNRLQSGIYYVRLVLLFN
jgi:hypothetical protein